MRRATAYLILALGLLVLLIVLLQSRYFFTSPPQSPSEVHRIGPLDIYPSSTNPGAGNPDITQDNVRQTICDPNWSTRSIRPPTSYTNRIKREEIGDYRYTDTDLHDYEEDHIIPLELGGAPDDPRNLWPEPYHASIPDGGARSKDRVENYLHIRVCEGKMTLAAAQNLIVTDWYAVLKQIESTASSAHN
jgi:hypothetical protein